MVTRSVCQPCLVVNNINNSKQMLFLTASGCYWHRQWGGLSTPFSYIGILTDLFLSPRWRKPENTNAPNWRVGHIFQKLPLWS